MGRIARRKVLRDLWLARGRMLVLILATAAGLVAVEAVLGAYAILAREMPRSFLSSRPASATLVLDGGADAALLEAVRRRPGVAAADRRAMVRARVAVAPERTLPLTLFVVEEFEAMRVETVSPIDGAWPPPTGALLLDRTSLSVLGTGVGARLTVSTAHGQPREVPVAGTVFDPGIAPAWQEQTGFGYVTPATLAWLGEPPELDLLKVRFADVPSDAAAIAREAQTLSAWLAEQGVAVEEIRIPPPGQHPHQGLMNALTLVLLLFGMLALGLSGLLVATMVAAMLARHVRQIGAMKAVGARPVQIGLMYGSMVAAIGATAVALAVGPGLLAGWALAGLDADLSNVEITSWAVPGWVFALVALTGLLTPLVAAAAPVARASRITVREAIADVGMYQGPAVVSAGGRGAWVARALGPTLTLALRQASRQRRRLALSLVLLAVGGGTFMSGLNVAAASATVVAAGVANLGYDLELTLSQPRTSEPVLQSVRDMPGVVYAEAVGFATVARVSPGAVPVAATHKDGGHGTERLYALAPDSRFRPAVESGRWLEPGDLDAAVVTPAQLARFGVPLGGTVALSVDGRPTTWRLVGVIATTRIPFGAVAGLYVSDAGFARATGRPVGWTDTVRVVTDEHDPAARQAVQRAIEGRLAADGIGLADVLDADRFRVALDGHMAIVQGMLLALGVVLGAVGALALASAMSLSVVERTREFGVMQTLGATPARVVWVVVAEALAVGAASWLGALAVGLGLSWLVGGVVGAAMFGLPLPFVLSPVAPPAWLAIALVSSAAASAIPAATAARLTVRETLAYA